MPVRRSSRRLPFDRPLQIEWITLGGCGLFTWRFGSGPVALAVLVNPG